MSAIGSWILKQLVSMFLSWATKLIALEMKISGRNSEIDRANDTHKDEVKKILENKEMTDDEKNNELIDSARRRLGLPVRTKDKPLPTPDKGNK